MAKKCIETYAKCIAKGYDWLDAMEQAGYKVDNLESAKRQKRNLDGDESIKKRIKELTEYYAKKENNPTDITEKLSPREYLESVFNNVENNPDHRLKAAIALMPYEEAKKGEKGVKESKIETAEQLAIGDYGSLTMQMQGKLFN
ncbi:MULTISPECIES: hypothetical protein [unclassified Moraxella]|uniref:hypothetical protein n=1 Tax=unclassified Moraxella TaxID=2685852 RepID=UPI00359D57AC